MVHYRMIYGTLAACKYNQQSNYSDIPDTDGAKDTKANKNVNRSAWHCREFRQDFSKKWL